MLDGPLDAYLSLDLLYEECLCYNFPQFEEQFFENIESGKGNIDRIIENGQYYNTVGL